MFKRIKLSLFIALLLTSFTLCLFGQTNDPGRLTFVVSGYVKTAASVPIQGVQMYVDNSPAKNSPLTSTPSVGVRNTGTLVATTNESGYYSFSSGPWIGSTFAPEKADYAFSPVDVVIGMGNITQNFVGTSNTMINFNSTGDMVSFFNPDPTPVYTNVSSGGIGNSGCVNMPIYSNDVWTRKVGVSVPAVGETSTISAMFHTRNDYGVMCLGFATASANQINSSYRITTASALTTYFHGNGAGFINNSSYPGNASWSQRQVADSWCKAYFTITNQGSNLFTAECQVWYADANGVTGRLRGTLNVTGLSNSALAGAGTIYPFFSSPTGADLIDDFDVQANQVLPSITPATNPSPAHQEEQVVVNPTLSWSAPTTGFIPTGYKLSLGTDSYPTNILNNLDLGLVTEYTPPAGLLYGTSYFWLVTPYNAQGDAIGIPVWNFYTVNYRNVSTTDLPTGGGAPISPSIFIWDASGSLDVNFSWNPDFETTLQDRGLVIQLTGGDYWDTYLEINPDLGYTPTWVAYRILPDDWFVMSQDDYEEWTSDFVNFDLNYGGYEWKGSSKAEGDVDIIFGGDPTITSFPYLNDFQIGKAGWTNQDISEDGYYWYRTSDGYPNYAIASYSGGSGANVDDWIYTPAVQLSAGTQYEIKYNYCTQSSVKNIELKVGTSADASAMTTLLDSHTGFSNQTYELGRGVYTPSVSGIYYFGIHDYSSFAYDDLYFDNFRITTIGNDVITVTSETSGGESYPTPAPIYNPVTNLPLNTSLAISGIVGFPIITTTVAWNPPGSSIPNAGLTFSLSSTTGSLSGATIVFTHNLGYVPAQVSYRIVPAGFNVLINPNNGTWTTTQCTVIVPAAKADGDFEIVFPADEGGTLPVTLSAFNAIPAADFNSVTLNWTVESETNHMGYDILRSDDTVLANALKVNSSIISEGSHNGSQVNYSYNDADLSTGSTYYYWLVSISLNSQVEYYGPVSVILVDPNTGGETPIIPLVTAFNKTYPNPFNPTMTIDYSLAKTERVEIVIYNMKGQKIRTLLNETKNPGQMTISWNGLSDNGISVASGVYYVKFKAGSYITTRKVVMMK